MYLSRLLLNPRSRQVQRELANPYEMHRTLSRAMPNSPMHVARNQEDVAGLLYRLDVHPQSGRLALLVQSQTQPDWAFLSPKQVDSESNQTYLITNDPWQEEANPAVKAIDLRIAAGQQLHFRLRANPTKRLSAGKGNKGKRVGIYDEEGLRTWLQRKASTGGFQVQSLRISQDEKLVRQAAIKQQDRIHKLELFRVQFDGVLQVTDPTAFLTAVQTGIGSGKAFGFGLLSLAPVRG